MLLYVALLMRTLKHRDVEEIAHGHTAFNVKLYSLESNLSLWTLTPAEPYLGSVLKKKKRKGCNLPQDAIAPRCHLDCVHKIVSFQKAAPNPDSGFILNGLASATVTSVFLLCSKSPDSLFLHQMAMWFSSKGMRCHAMH